MFVDQRQCPVMAALGPKRQFAAVQRYSRFRRNTGRSADEVDTAGLDPNRTPSRFGLGAKIKNFVTKTFGKRLHAPFQ
jgi:hypothetical protein